MKHLNIFLSAIIFLGMSLNSCKERLEVIAPEITGELKQWHKVILTFDGPMTGETNEINPFLNYRLQVEFSKEDRVYSVPGFYAADGNAAESGESQGNKWQVVFCPDDFGLWNYHVTFLHGSNVAIANTDDDAKPLPGHGYKGELYIKPTDKKGHDFRARGRIGYTGDHYLRFSGDGSPFLKAGADSPENFLGYVDFDNTYYGGKGDSRAGEADPNTRLHRFETHSQDWRMGDPAWHGGKGKGMIGALNYLASKGINSVYMLTNNVGGDGKDVFPWIEYNSDFTRFDVSKLAQWEIVFSHMDRLGMMCHFVTQETENELLLDSGNLGLTRKLYYRELIARFSHHLGITWNLGEENGVAPWLGYGQNDRQRKDMASYFKQHDPYGNFVVVHTMIDPPLREETLSNLLGYPDLNGPSLQTSIDDVHAETLKWRKRSAEKGIKWVVNSDEIGPASTGAKPDESDPDHDEIRHKVLWGNLMAGGGGVEWYFGYEFPHNDLNCEDWRSRDRLWEQTSLAVNFFQTHVPFTVMQPADSMVLPENHYCLARQDDLFLVYIPEGAHTSVKTNPSKRYQVKWFDPRSGRLIPDDTTYLGIDTLHVQLNGQDNRGDWVVMIGALN